MNQTKNKFWTTEKMISYSAVLVGLCVLVVSVYEANIFRNQQKAAVWPYLEFSYSNIDGFSYNLHNKGVGPAIMKWVIVRIDDKPVESWQDYIHMINDDSIHCNIISTYINSRVISANENVRMLSVQNHQVEENAIKNFNRMSIEFCYASIFDDYWIVRIDSTGIKCDKTKKCSVDTSVIFQN